MQNYVGMAYLRDRRYPVGSKKKGSPFLHGVPEVLVRAALSRAGGNELASGKFESRQSSAALAGNAVGWFIGRPSQLPIIPGLEDLDWPAVSVEVERQMRFPWRGGRHPWLDAAIETHDHLVGVESKRFEPFRVAKNVKLSAAYDRSVWGDNMLAFESMRDDLRSGSRCFAHLDAAQLVKHAFGLVTEGRRVGKAPHLLYLYVEAPCGVHGTPSLEALERHRGEISEFAAAVQGSEVHFHFCSYQKWLESWTGEAKGHAEALRASFEF